MKLQRTLRLLLALALLGVWQGALLHPLLHVDQKGAFVHVPGSHAPKGPGDKSGSNRLCDAIAAVAACVSGTARIAVAIDPGVVPIRSREIVALLGAPPPVYRSQAPPSLL